MTEPGYGDHIYVDLTSAEYAVRFTSSEAEVYWKTARVKAWLLTQDTPLTTVLADGTRETDRVASAGHWVVENPGGERYAIEPEEFGAGYDTTSEPGVFQAKGRIRAIQNTTGGPVWINAPWGEPQYGATDCSFACTVRADGSLDLAQPYIIGRAELNQTYAEDAVEAVPTGSELAPTRFISTGQAPAHLATARGSDTESGTERTGKATMEAVKHRAVHRHAPERSTGLYDTHRSRRDNGMTPAPTPPEEVTVHAGRRSGLRIVIAVDSTRLGPALGGCRIRSYPSLDSGRRDALRLASAMTLKAASAGLAHGGGKTVVVLSDGTAQIDPLQRRDLLLDVGEAVEAHGGRYLIGPDVGTGPNDMDVIAERTSHVLCCTERAHGSGDSAPATAAGSYGCIRTVREHLTGAASVAAVRIGIVGLGSVGRRLACALAEDGADLFVTDVDPSCRAIAQRVGARWVEPDVLPTLELDVLVPAAMGGLIDDEVANRLRCSAVVGPANNQLSDERLADVLHRHGVLWAPDYIVGAGGIVNAVAREVDGADGAESRARVVSIAATLRSVLVDAVQHNRTPHDIATDRARERLRCAPSASADAS